MKRKAAYPIDDIILHRWSPRAMSGASISDEQLMSLFEAARWAPSSYNNQPWRFVYAKRDAPEWQTFFDLLVPFNQSWAKDAAALVIIASRNNFTHNNKPSRTHAFDTGAAWQNLALQGYKDNLVVHAMEGFDYEKAAEVINLPEGHTIHAMIAIGLPGDPAQLPQDLQARETPSDREPMQAFVHEGVFKRDKWSNLTPEEIAKADASGTAKPLRLWARLADQENPKELGVTPLHQAAFAGDLIKVNRLIQQGAEVNARDQYDWTPLHDAVIQGHLDIVKALITAGADVNAQDNEERYAPLHEAARMQYPEIKQILLAAGADPTITNNIGETPSDIEDRW